MTTTTAPVVTVQSEKEQLMARIAQLEAKLEAKKTNDGSVIKLTTPTTKKDGTVSNGGSLSMYGLGHYPVTLTFTQWMKVAKQLPALLIFASANYGKLFFKSDEQSDAAAAFLKSVK